MKLSERYQMYYTTSEINEDKVDAIDVDLLEDNYTIYYNESELITDGFFFEDESEFDSVYVSRPIFEIIKQGLEDSSIFKLKKIVKGE